MKEADITVTEGSFINGRNQNLHTYNYVPRRLSACLVFHHGFGEHRVLVKQATTGDVFVSQNDASVVTNSCEPGASQVHTATAS